MTELRSRGGASDACVLRFNNERSAGVLVFWLDYDGKAVPYGVIPAGNSVEQSTFTGHAWRLCDEATGAALAEYVGTSAIVTLQGDGSVRVASTSAASLEGFAEPGGGAAVEEAADGSDAGSEQA